MDFMIKRDIFDWQAAKPVPLRVTGQIHVEANKG
jgi:hypothetical protein